LITSVPKITNDMDIYSSNGKICVKSEIATKINIYSISGLVYPVNLHPGLNEFTLPKGIYIVKREKLILQ
jgi:hypothetical protein